MIYFAIYTIVSIIYLTGVNQILNKVGLRKKNTARCVQYYAFCWLCCVLLDTGLFVGLSMLWQTNIDNGKMESSVGRNFHFSNTRFNSSLHQKAQTTKSYTDIRKRNMCRWRYKNWYSNVLHFFTENGTFIYLFLFIKSLACVNKYLK